MRTHIKIVAWFLLLIEAYQSLETEDDFYTAGVVEFSQLTSTSSGMNARLNAFISIINSTEAEPTDILVFPESSLNNYNYLTYLPSISENIVPCEKFVNEYGEEFHTFLSDLSCAARTARKYVVVNLLEKENCSRAAILNKDPRPCAPNNLNVYNSNVVFDRQGRIISTYRKFNVYTEPSNHTLLPQYSIFDTDFGVRFAHFICFDLIFYSPAEELVQRFGIQNLILTIHFYSELPFLTSVQLQQSWAWGNNVNLLGSGGSYPALGTTGTGIFSGTAGALEMLMTGDFGVRKLLIAKVPKKPGQVQANSYKKQEPQTKVALLQDPEIERFNSELVDFTQETQHTRDLCQRGHCCHFDIETIVLEPASEPSVWYQYRIGVFNGRRSYVKREFSDLLVCAVYACTNSSVNSCGLIFKDSTLNVQPNFAFKSIHIQGDFLLARHMLLMPNSVDVALYPLPASMVEWNVTKHKDYDTARYKLNTEMENLLSFGIYGNYYLRENATFL